MEKKSTKQEGGRGQEWRGERRRAEEFCFYFYYFFLCFFFFFRSTKIGPQVFVGTEGKVDLRDESYAWIPKSWSFDKLREVENFPSVIFSLKAI